ncbi:MAG: PQQ-binding-like beta-propeller repeat protein [Polyangiaceae bacterium]
MTTTTYRILRRGLLLSALPLVLSACGGSTPSVDYGRPDQRRDLDMGMMPRMPVDPPGPVGRPAQTPNDHRTGPNGESAGWDGNRVLIRFSDGSTYDVEPERFHPPPGDRSLVSIVPTAVFYRADGSLLVGVVDGTLTALGPDYGHLWSVGFRGAVHQIADIGGGAVAITTTRGVLAVVEQNGSVRWERQITAEILSAPAVTDPRMILTASVRGLFAYSPAGGLLWSHASRGFHFRCSYSDTECDATRPPAVWIEQGTIRANELSTKSEDAHLPVPSLLPSYPLTWTKVVDGSIVSVVPHGSTGVAALVTHRTKRTDYDWDTDDKYDVVTVDGDKQTRASIPQVAPKSEVFVEGTKPGNGAVFVDALVQGPNGNPWVIARRMNGEKTLTGDALLGRWGGAGMIFEVTNGKATERRDLFPTFVTHWLSLPMAGTATGSPAVLCFGEEDPTCAVHDGTTFRLAPPPVRIQRVRRVGGAVWLLTPEGQAYRADGKTLASWEAVTEAQDKALVSVAGVSEQDMWGDAQDQYSLFHRVGTKWSEVPVPFAGEALSVLASDDAWYGGAHWDGKRWSVTGGVTASESTYARAKDDVWIGDDHGLWHGTGPGPSPVSLADPAPGPMTSTRPAALPMGAPDSSYSATKTAVPVRGEAALTGASNVAVSADGVVWMLARDRVVEVSSAGKGTTLRFTGREGFGKWAVPEGKGRGLLLQRDEGRGMDRRDEIRRLDGNATTTPPLQFDRQDAVAASVGAGGVAWILGRPAEFERSSQFREPSKTLLRQGITSFEDFGAHAIVRTETGSYRPVLGLPAASWCDVAAAADGGAWFAGGLNAGPSGEGILVRLKGALGAAGVVRYRAKAALFAVSAAGPDEAWAVGAGGTLVHVQAGTLTPYSIPSGEWLRSVYAAAPNDVWLGGDGGTLLHFDGKELHPIAHPLGPNATFTGIAATATAIWAVGPTGIVELKKR